MEEESCSLDTGCPVCSACQAKDRRRVLDEVSAAVCAEILRLERPIRGDDIIAIVRRLRATTQTEGK